MQKLNSDTFDEIAYDDGESCLVMFTRKTCHVCQAVHPKLEELEEDYKGKFGFYEVDVEEQRNLFQRFSLKGVPQILFFKDGEVVSKKAGDHDIEEFEDKINEIIA
ncbi:thioredoxin family protein [Curtanaerobium respiraculi]|uniref:thioredoxin family protein n=1 Tax=Curtanaerobium respiraculi TaxID=2949669 RepID=UPI0024B325BC|nr:thioredoxin family protein [Curtanaerobium respiraculi]